MENKNWGSQAACKGRTEEPFGRGRPRTAPSRSARGARCAPSDRLRYAPKPAIIPGLADHRICTAPTWPVACGTRCVTTRLARPARALRGERGR
jgi:hypothetical protein